MRGSRTVRSVKRDGEFFDALATGVPVQAALNVSGYKRETVYNWRRDNESFRNQWENATSQAREAMEAEADRRGVEGTLKPVFYRGEQCGEIREYSDTLLMFRLKALAPDKYRENSKQEIEHTGQPITQVVIIMPNAPKIVEGELGDGTLPSDPYRDAQVIEGEIGEVSKQ